MEKEQDKQDDQTLDKNKAEAIVSSTVGRDGAYLEMDVLDMGILIDASRNVEPVNARMIVLKSARIDISDGAVLKKFLRVFDDLLDSKETDGMDNAQQGMYIVRKIFEAGVNSLAGE